MKQPRERPIIFNEWSIQRTLHLAKSQTRRVIKPQPDRGVTALVPRRTYAGNILWGNEFNNNPDVSAVVELVSRKCPYGQAGDLLYVRETWQALHEKPHWTNTDYGWEVGSVNWVEYEGELSEKAYGNKFIVAYRADADKRERNEIRWRPSIHMPKWASRIWLRVEDVRVERVQDISEEDAIAEGIGHGFQMNSGWPDYQHIDDNGHCTLTQDTPVMSFATLWDSIYADSDYAWDTNCWVWAITFSVLSTTGKPLELEAEAA